MAMDCVIERKLWLVDTGTGAKVDLCIEIGRPRWTAPDHEAVCPVWIRGLMPAPLDIFGADLMNALECGLDFVKTELKSLPGNQSVQWPGGEAYFD
jgi:hypothetical protein